MNIWFISDPHFGHENMLRFTKKDGALCRPGFKDIVDMNETIIANYNARVGQYDKVYFCGDIAFKLQIFHSIMPRLKGHKRLILGNHDRFQMSEYAKFFDKIMESWQPVRNTVITHRPILLGDHDHHAKTQANIHGHTHTDIIEDPRYMNICVENTNYAPIHWDEIAKEYLKRGIKIGNY